MIIINLADFKSKSKFFPLNVVLKSTEITIIFEFKFVSLIK